MRSLSRLLILLMAALVLGQGMVYAQKTARGTVKDADGKPLAGVTVLIQGTSTGTMTGADGSWSLSVPDGAVLEFSCLGMTTQTRPFQGQSRVDVTMTEDTLYLEDVVVVGYGTAKKETLTAAVSAIKGDELLKAPSTNVSQVLAGKLSGVSSVQESGEPGLDQASLRIRGSVYGVAYVVDGFPVDNINDIDPADIESVSVLKDGASAAVYGLQAAGGVIIITTRKGDKGDAHITYNGSVGVSMNANFPRFMNGPQFAYYYNLAQEMDQLASGWDNVDYIKKVFGTGVTNKHNITVQGGNDKSRYFVSGGFLGQKGNIDGYNYNRYNVRANIESRIASHLVFNAGLSGVVGRRRTPRFLSGGSDSDAGYEVGWFSIAHQVIGMYPFLPEKYDGYYTGAIASNQVFPNSPLAALYQSGNKQTRSFNGTLTGSLTWEIPWVKGLSAKASGSYDYLDSYNKNLDTPYYVVVRRRNEDGTWGWTDPMVDVNGASDGNKVGEGSYYQQTMTGQASLNYAGTFGKHAVEVLALAEIRDFQTNNLSAYVKNVPFALLPELGNGTPTASPVMGSSNASRSAGYVGRIRSRRPPWAGCFRKNPSCRMHRPWTT